MIKYVVALIIAFSSINTEARKHHLKIEDDVRKYIPLSTFGFYQGGVLDVKLYNFKLQQGKENFIYGFSLDKTQQSDALNPYLDNHQVQCILEDTNVQANGPIIFFTMKFNQNIVQLNCTNIWPNLHIYKNESLIPFFRPKYSTSRQRREFHEKSEESPCNQLVLPLTSFKKDKTTYYSFNFVMYVATKQEEGLYNLYFHSCPNYNNLYETTSFELKLEENNSGNYLSASEMPLPALYFMMSILFFMSGLLWVFILRKSKNPVFKIHYLMALLVFLKSLSLMFHSINFHFIEIRGEHVETWAILFYITHLMKGAVLFITIVLIGTGWTFIKHILGDKDKKLFMIVIPLQVLANVAEIIIAESEEGAIEHRTWLDVFILVDLLCCAAILFPVVWSIRHLQEASATDGKALINLKKLKLFRQFYIMIVCYIYFTRIIVYLLKITVAFNYAWLDEMFREMATYIFFVWTGYKFRPTPTHPYFNVRDESDDEVEILTQSGLTENIRNVTNRNMCLSTSVEGFEDEKENLINKRESSHEYD